ncbi:unnamed protein product [Cuscuta campestris]|uniref:Uncharacterized protein n=1 Tax=Cuscuta campestris TaxID=132261 RepID=A0A484MGG5_9ASTE|nr:unnamed protein product [Cuscuta campestris]
MIRTDIGLDEIYIYLRNCSFIILTLKLSLDFPLSNQSLPFIFFFSFQIPRSPISTPPNTKKPPSSSFLKKPACTTVAVSLGVSILSAAPTAVTPTSQSAAASFNLLERHLSTQNVCHVSRS